MPAVASEWHQGRDAGRGVPLTVDRVRPGSPFADGGQVPSLQICILGTFDLQARARSFSLKPGGKSQQFLVALALEGRRGVTRHELFGLVWPETDESFAAQSLHTLVHETNRRLAPALEGEAAVVRQGDRYRLNSAAGVVVDVQAFEEAAEAGDRFGREGDALGAIECYDRAVALYAGDLVLASDVRYVLERERLRARHLSIRARLADHHFGTDDFAAALREALALLATDPCREDAHRMAMRCFVRLGERAQALRQYRVCVELLRIEFDVEPETATLALFEAIRLNPGAV